MSVTYNGTDQLKTQTEKNHTIYNGFNTSTENLGNILENPCIGEPIILKTTAAING